MSQLDARLKEIRRKSSDVQIYFAAIVYWHVGNYKHALEYVDRLIKNNENFKQVSFYKFKISVTYMVKVFFLLLVMLKLGFFTLFF